MFPFGLMNPALLADLAKKVADPNFDLIPGVDNPYNNAPAAPAKKPTGKTGGGGANVGAEVLAANTGAGGAPVVNYAMVDELRKAIKGNRPAIEEAYNALFGDLDSLARDRVSDIDRKLGENTAALTGQYTEALPALDQSYAAVGAFDSTNRGDARTKAKTGYEKSVKEVGDAAGEERTKVGQYVTENKAKYGADKDSVLRMIDRVDQTEDEGDLRQARNDVEGKFGDLGVQRATLQSDAGAKGALKGIGAGNERFNSIKASLDQIVNSSMANGVKAAAVEAVANSADLTDEDRQKIKLEYGQVYDTPAVV